MTQVMDVENNAGNILFRELCNRFPEVPVDVVVSIMQKSGYNRERSIEALARECQKYQYVLYGNQHVRNATPYREGFTNQHSDSNESRGSLSSLSSCPGGSCDMHASLSYSNLTPTEYVANLPLTNVGYSPQHGFSCSSLATPYSSIFGGDPLPRQSSFVPQGVFGNQECCTTAPLDIQPGSHSSQKTVKSEVNYLVGVSDAGGNSSAVQMPHWSQKPVYKTERYVAVVPPPLNSGTPPDASKANVPAELVDPANRLAGTRMMPTSEARSPNSYSAIYMNPQQAWINPMHPKRFISSCSSSCESLPSASASEGHDLKRLQLPTADSVIHQNGSPSRPGGIGANEYLQVLKSYQTGNLENLSRKLRERFTYLCELRATIHSLEFQFKQRLDDRLRAFPSTEDVEKLRSENGQLQIDIQLLAHEIDLANDGQMLLGEFNPECYPNRTPPSCPAVARVPSASAGMPTAAALSPPPYPQSPGSNVPGTPIVPAADEESDWSCSVCTFLNNAALKQCEMCEWPRITTPRR